MEPLLPPALEVGLVVLAEAADATAAPIRGEVGVEPRSDLLPECFLFSREAEVHGQIMKGSRLTGRRP
jgi:hypothetical protein